MLAINQHHQHCYKATYVIDVINKSDITSSPSPPSLITTPPAPLKRFNFTSLQTLGKIQLPESPSKYIPTQTKYNSPKTLS